MSLPEHRRVLPAFDISEEGLRQLEIWLRDRIGQGGSGWRFNVLNGDPSAKPSERGYGYVLTTECFDLDRAVDPTSTGGDWGFALLDQSGCGLIIGSDFGILIKSRGGDTNILADGGDVGVSTNNGDIVIAAFNGNTSVDILTSGKTYTINDHLGSPLVTYTG